MNMTKLLIIGAVAAILAIPGSALIQAFPDEPSGGDDYILGQDKPGKKGDKINALGGDDQVWGLAGDDDIKGGAGDDHLVGGEGKDKIRGGEGNDNISGEEGNDELIGGNGDDRVEGNDGDDIVDGGTGNDIVGGGDGDDQVKGGSGNDFVSGGNGDDQVTGSEGDDVLEGGAGNDDIFAGEGDDILFGNEDDDILHGGPGQNDLDGGEDCDTYNWDGGPTFDSGDGPGVFIDPVTLQVFARDDTIPLVLDACDVFNVINPNDSGSGAPPSVPPPPAEDTTFDEIIARINAGINAEIKKKDTRVMINILEDTQSIFTSTGVGEAAVCAGLVDFEAEVDALSSDGDIDFSLEEDLIGPTGDDLLADLEAATGCPLP